VIIAFDIKIENCEKNFLTDFDRKGETMLDNLVCGA